MRRNAGRWETACMGRSTGRCFFSTRDRVQKSPWPSWLGGEAVINLIEGPVACCTTLQAVTLADMWFKAFQEIKICLAECSRSAGTIQGQLWLCYLTVI